MPQRKIHREENKHRIGWFIAWYSSRTNEGGLIKYKENNQAVRTDSIVDAIDKCVYLSDTSHLLCWPQKFDASGLMQ